MMLATLQKRVTVEFVDIIAEFDVELSYDANGGYWSLVVVNPVELDDCSGAEPFLLDPDAVVVDWLNELWTEHIDGTANYFTVVEECVGSHGEVGCYLKVNETAGLGAAEVEAAEQVPLTPLPILGLAIMAQAARAAVLESCVPWSWVLEAGAPEEFQKHVPLIK